MLIQELGGIADNRAVFARRFFAPCRCHLGHLLGDLDLIGATHPVEQRVPLELLRGAVVRATPPTNQRLGEKAPRCSTPHIEIDALALGVLARFLGQYAGAEKRIAVAHGFRLAIPVDALEHRTLRIVLVRRVADLGQRHRRPAELDGVRSFLHRGAGFEAVAVEPGLFSRDAMSKTHPRSELVCKTSGGLADVLGHDVHDRARVVDQEGRGAELGAQALGHDERFCKQRDLLFERRALGVTLGHDRQRRTVAVREALGEPVEVGLGELLALRLRAQRRERTQVRLGQACHCGVSAGRVFTQRQLRKVRIGALLGRSAYTCASNARSRHGFTSK